jgi:hypothetical protein
MQLVLHLVLKLLSSQLGTRTLASLHVVLKVRDTNAYVEEMHH